MVKGQARTNSAKPTRMSFSRIDEVIGMPNLIEIQKNSYQLVPGGRPARGFPRHRHAIEDYTGNLALELCGLSASTRSRSTAIKECKERDATYAAPLRVTARLLNKETGEVKEQEIFMGDFPLMTDAGTFVIQRCRACDRLLSWSVLPACSTAACQGYGAGKDLFTATMNPNRGAWLEYETDASNVFYVRIDKNRKLPVTVLLPCTGPVHQRGYPEVLRRRLSRRSTGHPGKGYHPQTPRTRACWKFTASCAPASLPTVESSRYQPEQHAVLRPAPLRSVPVRPLQDEQEAQSLARRIIGFVAAENVVDPLTGEAAGRQGRCQDHHGEMAEEGRQRRCAPASLS